MLKQWNAKNLCNKWFLCRFSIKHENLRVNCIKVWIYKSVGDWCGQLWSLFGAEDKSAQYLPSQWTGLAQSVRPTRGGLCWKRRKELIFPRFLLFSDCYNFPRAEIDSCGPEVATLSTSPAIWWRTLQITHLGLHFHKSFPDPSNKRIMSWRRNWKLID